MTGVAKKTQFQDYGEIQTMENAAQMIQNLSAPIGILLPDERQATRWKAVAMNVFQKQPDLLSCTPASLANCFRQSAELGLEPSGTLGHMYFVPFKTRKKYQDPDGKTREIWTKDATPIPGYRGFIELCRRAGGTKVEARVVREGDHIKIVEGDEPRIEHTPKLEFGQGKRPIVLVYAIARLPNGERIHDWMPLEDVEKVRQKSRGKDSLMWVEFFEEGARKTVVRRLAKYLPLTPELTHAIELDDAQYQPEEREEGEGLRGPALDLAKAVGAETKESTDD